MPQLSPVIAQHEFAARIRQQRERIGLASAEVSRHLGFTRNFYSAVENCRGWLSPGKLTALVEILEFEADEAELLSELLAQSKRNRWWQPYVSSRGDSFVRYVGLESGASTISSYEGLLFNGLLQSPAYAREVVGASPNTSPVDVERIVALRLRRQEELFERRPLPRMTFLLSEAVLMQQFGGPEVLRGQLAHVLQLADRLGDRLDLRIQTFGVTPLGLTTASTLVILEFDSPFVSPIAYREAGAPIGIADDPALVSKLRLHYSQALVSSTEHNDSLELIAQRRDLV